MNAHKFGLILFFFFLLAGCSSMFSPIAGTEIPDVPSATATLTPTPIVSPSATLAIQPVYTITPHPYPIVLPAITMLPQESEKALLELLRTNGECTGKCIAGIWPDAMTVQDAVDNLAQWGMVRIDKDSQNKTFINLIQSPLYGKIIVALSVGTWTKEFETIDYVSILIKGSELFLEEEVWQANRDARKGFSLSNILQTYDKPSFVGYYFETTVESGMSLDGRTIRYGMNMHYEQTNMVVWIGAMANYDGKNLFLCPSKDPRSLQIEINPESSLRELQKFYPVTWEELTGTNLEEFYRKFASNINPDPCIVTTLEKIQRLQPDFH